MKRALVLSLICVVGLAFAGFAQTLTGSWITQVCIDPQTDWLTALSLTSTLGVTYAIGDWAFTSTTVLDEDGWSDQDFSVTGLFGLIDVTSALGFTVDPVGFDSWVTTLILNMAGVEFTGVFTLETNSSSLALGMVAGIGSAVEGSVDVVLGDGEGCNFNFVSAEIGLDFLFCDCAAIEATIFFSCTNGFEYITFATSGIAIPNLPWVTLGASLKFTPTDKEITITPAFDFGPIVCFDLFFDVEENGAQTFPGDTLFLDTIEVTGIGIGCTIGGVEFYALSMFDGSLAPYWEKYTISVSEDACCGGLFEFDLALWFAEGAGTLFELSLIEADMSVNVTEDFKFTMALDVDLALGFTVWCVGFAVNW